MIKSLTISSSPLVSTLTPPRDSWKCWCVILPHGEGVLIWVLFLSAARNLHLIWWAVRWLLKHCCFLQFIHCNKRLGILNAKLRLRADKPDMTVKWAFPGPRQPCGDLNKTKRRPWNKQDNYGLGCRAPVCLPVAFIPQTLNRNKSPLVTGRHLWAAPQSVQQQILRPWQMKMNLLFLHS